MRECLPGAEGAEHFGLAYDVLGVAPAGQDDNRLSLKRQDWLKACASMQTPDDYQSHYRRWKASFGADAKLFEVTMASRLLIGHGNASASEVGLTVHRSWGTPVMPGTALKGLVSGYVDAVYGPDPDAPVSTDANRGDWAAPTWKGRRVVEPPGRWHAAIFGSPAVDAGHRQGLKGGVFFHDALYIPEGNSCTPFEVDVLTVHQKQYYDSSGREWPNDWTDPVPVGFISLKPGARFLLALEGPPRARDLALKLLLSALGNRGIGGKTSLGYGLIDTTPMLPAATQGAVWLDAKLQELMGKHNSSEQTTLRGEPLAAEWRAIDDPVVKQQARDEIEARWKELGWWDNTRGKAARRAKAIYQGIDTNE